MSTSLLIINRVKNAIISKLLWLPIPKNIVNYFIMFTILEIIQWQFVIDTYIFIMDTLYLFVINDNISKN